MRWTIQTRLSDGREHRSSWTWWTRRGAEQHARLATLGSGARHIWTAVRVRR